MIDRGSKLSVTRQCEMLDLNRTGVYYAPRPVSQADLKLMRRMGIEALYRKPRTSIAPRGASIYPYLLDHLVIDRPNQVWATDITYLSMAHGFMYLAAILDVASRKVLAFRTSNTLTTDFCVEALQEALARYGTPEIFNTDQGWQFTSAGCTSPTTTARPTKCITTGTMARWRWRREQQRCSPEHRSTHRTFCRLRRQTALCVR